MFNHPCFFLFSFMYWVDISTFLSLCMTGYRYKPGNLSIRIAGTARLIHWTVDTHLIDHKIVENDDNDTWQWWMLMLKMNRVSYNEVSVCKSKLLWAKMWGFRQIETWLQREVILNVVFQSPSTSNMLLTPWVCISQPIRRKTDAQTIIVN